MCRNVRIRVDRVQQKNIILLETDVNGKNAVEIYSEGKVSNRRCRQQPTARDNLM